MSEVVGIDGDEVAPARGHGEIFVNGFYGADRQARATVNANTRIDVILLIILAGVNAIDRADIDARSVFLTDARFGYHIRHRTRSFQEEQQHYQAEPADRE
jgi:hypothetical protein